MPSGSDTGIWIPSWVLEDERMTVAEKIVLSEIIALAKKGGCYASNRHLARRCCLSERTVIRTIERLTDLGLVEQWTPSGGRRLLIPTVPEGYDILSHSVTFCQSEYDILSPRSENIKRYKKKYIKKKVNAFHNFEGRDSEGLNDLALRRQKGETDGNTV